MPRATGSNHSNLSGLSSLPDWLLQSALSSLKPNDLEALRQEASRRAPWTPYPGPQSLAYLSPADELYYGGAAGGGKTQLVIGLAVTAHRDTLLLRRRAIDAKAISKSLQGLGYGTWKWAGSGGELRTPDDRTIEVGGCEHDKDKAKYQGNPHDLIAFDELPTFLESQYTFIIGWNRPLRPDRFPGQRCRVVGAGNPPTDPEGEWVLRRWRAWLDPTVGKKARPGELRWYTTIAQKEVECEDGRPVVVAGKQYLPRSRTFIPARLEDNPALVQTGYAATLEAMPEPLRSILRYGDMTAARRDDRWQLIPTRWVIEAQKRWARRERATWGPPATLGVDVAMEGTDWTVLAPRYGMTVGELIRRLGAETPDGPSIVALIMASGFAGVAVNIDAIGIGKSAYDMALMHSISRAQAVIASSGTEWRDPNVPTLRFANLRAAMLWNVRCLLDPDGGPDDSRLALPPDTDLLVDLTAPRYALRASGILVESKEDIRKRIGRSTDSGDAVALACWETHQTLESYTQDDQASPFDRLPEDIWR